jgi:hypothetical protein
MHEPSVRIAINPEPLPVIVDHGEERFEALLLARQENGAVLLSSEWPATGSLLVCHVRPEAGTPPSVVLEGAVVGSGTAPPTASGARGFVLRWNWAWVKGGVALLGELLTDTLGMEGDLDPARIVLVNPGALYSLTGSATVDPEECERRVQRARLAAARAEVLAGGVRPPTEDAPLARLRAHERVRLDAPCHFSTAEWDRPGRIYNIAREGVFVLTDEALPREGDVVVVRIAVRTQGRALPVELTGVVRWRAESPRSARGGGFGVHVRAVADSEHGRLFNAFLDELLTHHYAASSAPEWVPVDHGPGVVVGAGGAGGAAE